MLRAQGVCALVGALCLGMPAAAAAQGMGVGVKGGLAIAASAVWRSVDQVIGRKASAVKAWRDSRRLRRFQSRSVLVSTKLCAMKGRT